MAWWLGGIKRVDPKSPHATKGSAMTTGKRDASKASKLLRTSKSKVVRSVAGSDLAQAKRKSKKKK